MLNDRFEQILNAVVMAYLNTGKPVGSGTLARQISLSPASIRNVMCDLEQMGLLHAPHTSAGRIPTDQGLRYFVDALMVVDEDVKLRAEQLIAEHLDHDVDVEGVLHQASDELASMTHFAGFASVHEIGSANIARLDLVPVSSEQLLAVMVSDSGNAHHRLLPRDRSMPDARLAELGSRLTELLQGCTFEQARLRLRMEMDSDRLRMRELLLEMERWTQVTSHAQPELIVSGQHQLLDTPEFSVISTVRSLLSAFEEKETLLDLIEQVERANSGVQVFIGSEHALVNMEQASVVLARYEGPSKLAGTLGVIGPRRMHYESVLPLVDCAAKWVSRMFRG